MNSQIIQPDKEISLLVKNIWVFENADKKASSSLPFFADGHPGLMFQQTENGLTVNPHKKLMPVMFLYGQTIQPVQLNIEGTYLLIGFQLYPFVLKNIFGVDPGPVIDDCYDLSKLKELDIPRLTRILLSLQHTSEKISEISSLLSQLFQLRKENIDLTISQTIEMIISSRGQEDINSIFQQFNLSKRTLERRFMAETGLSPKQFAKIIQFDSSLQQLTGKDYKKLTDIVYENGYADQSHFIKVFKSFTGKTPKAFNT